jgi:BirA family biotin operon repressor/biotin-[acetyl-CoA-carboxylase] ligase
MHLPLSRSVAQHLDVVSEVGSTNVELAARAAAGTEPHFAVLVTTNQTAGKGRLGRTWVAPPGKTIAVSVLLRTELSDRIGWLPLLAGLAMTRAVSSVVSDHSVTLKWPNDVHVDGLKVSGLLAEIVPSGVVIGAGLNLTMTEDELPTPTSTSLTLVGVPEQDIEDVALSAYLRALDGLYSEFAAEGFDASRGLRAAVTAACDTIGREVRVELPGGSDFFGTAESIDELGRLVVRAHDGVHAVAAGDVTHLRYG